MKAIFFILLLISSIFVSEQATARDFENEGVSFSSKIKMLRDAGEDTELAFESRKGIFLLSHATKDYEKIKAMLSMARERESVVKVTIDSMSDQILSATEVKGSGGEKSKDKGKKTDPNSNW